MELIKRLVAGLAMLCVVGQAFAEASKTIYRTVDESGAVSFSDTPPAGDVPAETLTIDISRTSRRCVRQQIEWLRIAASEKRIVPRCASLRQRKRPRCRRHHPRLLSVITPAGMEVMEEVTVTRWAARPGVPVIIPGQSIRFTGHR